MKITHHLDEATVLAYAAGTLGEAHGFVAATHLAYCPQCRAAVRNAEQLGGGLLLEQEAAAVSDTCRSATLASLDGARPAAARTRVSAAAPVPPVLGSLLGNVPLDNLGWKTKGPGVSMVDVPLSPGSATQLKLLRIKPGRTMPEHGHGGEELTVVLRGSYRDHIGHYQVGDVADLDTEVEHQPVAGEGDDCICLVAIEAPTRFKSFWARLVQPLVGI